MANGDAAAAKGIAVVPASKDLKLGYDDINRALDLIAGLMDSVASVQTAALALLPPGTSIQGYWRVAPTGYVLEAGQYLLKAGTYANLYAAIGDIHNDAGTPTGYFRVPDSRGRVQAGLAPAAFGNPDFTFLGGTPGVYQVSLTAAQNGTHTHGVNSVIQGLVGYAVEMQGTGTIGRGITGPTNTGTDASGSGAPHNNVQPTIIVNRALKF
ncbi:tail fiber protein [Agreia sp. VKM Ac-1783]|uniref:tail fiber protein n=1 Tax=Agreia sp. VKM Ac-1783 TaxID=1938889 RepID=UPI000A2AD92A|nr:tail fiber protein [Agreia sp. VKM Ac-1783]SMQ73454.1 Microcystin-dependent protein [Agreia sp. VKM Ac-1783]